MLSFREDSTEKEQIVQYVDENVQSKPHAWLNSYKQWSRILIKYAGAQKAVRVQVPFPAKSESLFLCAGGV